MNVVRCMSFGFAGSHGLVESFYIPLLRLLMNRAVKMYNKNCVHNRDVFFLSVYIQYYGSV